MEFCSSNDHNLYINKQADVGLAEQCGLTTGNDSMANCPLTATNVNLMGTLNLDHFSRLNQSNSVDVMKECPGGVHWETLTDTNHKTGVYLVCGNSSNQGCSAADISAAQSQVATLKSTACNDCGTYSNASYSCNASTGQVTVNQGECSIAAVNINTACYTYTWDSDYRYKCTANIVGNVIQNVQSTAASKQNWNCLGCSRWSGASSSSGGDVCNDMYLR